MRASEAALLSSAVALSVLLLEMACGIGSGLQYVQAVRQTATVLPLFVSYLAAFVALGLLVRWVFARLGWRHDAICHAVITTQVAWIIGGLWSVHPAVQRILTRSPWSVLFAAALVAIFCAPLALARYGPRWLRGAAPFLATALVVAMAGAAARAPFLLPSQLLEAATQLRLGAVLVGALLAAAPIGFALRDAQARNTRRRLLAAAGVLLAANLLLLVLPFGWMDPLSTRRRVEAGARGPSVLLVVIDTLRADSVSPTGAAAGTTPHFERFAADAVVFERAHSAAPWTLPSFASILTGTYTTQHGAGMRDAASGLRSPMSGTLPTIAEALRARGHATAAVLTNTYLEEAYGVGRGFDAYECLTWAFFYHPVTVLLHDLALGPRGPHVEGEAQHERILAMVDRLEATGAAWLLRAHFMDPHEPYRSHPGIEQRGYPGEVAYVDRWLGAVLDRLRERGLYDDLMIVVTSDHGEELGEGRSETANPLRAEGSTPHGFSLFEELLHVPLLVKLPGSDPGTRGIRVAAPVSLVDLAPTILGVVGIEPLESFQGIDLRTLIKASPPAEERTLFAGGLMEDQQMGAALRGACKLIAGGWPPVEASSRLFHLESDPGELRPLPVSDASAPCASLFPELRSLSAAGRGERATAVEASPRLRNQLRALGYAE